MHDPFVVAFEIRRPWPERSGRGRRPYWPPIITVWHREPGGHDCGTVCQHWRDGKIRHGWRFHVHHWRIQIHGLQRLRRRLLTRCSWCGGRERNGDAVNRSHQWDRKPTPWWRGEVGLYHDDCSAVATAWAGCCCIAPICADADTNGHPYGHCLVCDKTRGFGLRAEIATYRRALMQIPKFTRDRGAYTAALRQLQLTQGTADVPS